MECLSFIPVMVGPGFGSTFPDIRRRRETQRRGKMKSQDALHAHEVKSLAIRLTRPRKKKAAVPGPYSCSPLRQIYHDS